MPTYRERLDALTDKRLCKHLAGLDGSWQNMAMLEKEIIDNSNETLMAQLEACDATASTQISDQNTKDSDRKTKNQSMKDYDISTITTLAKVREFLQLYQDSIK